VPHAPRPAISRRNVLRGFLAAAGAGATVAVLASCDLLPATHLPTPEVPTELAAFLAGIVALGDRYDATITAVPALSQTLTPIRDAHRAHATALAQALQVTVPAATAPPPAPPTSRNPALAALAAAEKAGRDQAATICLAADARYAALLGSIAAARATHVEVLT
jgi:hypothetical protein